MSGRAELVDSLDGEARRTRERIWDLGRTFDSLADGIRDAAQLPGDDLDIAARLRLVATSGAILVSELSAVAGRLDALGTLLRDA